MGTPGTGGNVPYSDLPTWTVSLGGEWMMTHIDIITAETEAGVTDGKLNPSDILISWNSGAFASIGTFTSTAVG